MLGLPLASALRHLNDELARTGFVVSNGTAVGHGLDFRDHIISEYFDTGIVHRQEPDIPKDRLRARDVIRFERRTDGYRFTPESDVSLPASPGSSARRHYERTAFIADPMMLSWTSTVLSIVPDDEACPSGTFGINLFRTFTDVVTSTHRDNVRYVVIYVLKHLGAGAMTTLSLDDGSAALSRQLNEGELLMFSDARFMHWTDPLETGPDGTAPVRDVLICTVDR